MSIFFCDFSLKNWIMSAPVASATQLTLPEFEGRWWWIYLHRFISAGPRVFRFKAGQKWNGALKSTLGNRCLLSLCAVLCCVCRCCRRKKIHFPKIISTDPTLYSWQQMADLTKKNSQLQPFANWLPFRNLINIFHINKSWILPI